MCAREAARLEQMVLVLRDLGCRKQRIKRAKEGHGVEIFHPVDNDPANIFAHGKEPCREGLRELGVHFAGVLHDLALDDVNMLAFQGGDRTITRTGEQGEGHNGSVTQLDIGDGRHGLQHMPDLVDGRHRPLGNSLGDPGLLIGQREVLGVGGG
jgi:hypothetical protein